MFRGTCRRLNVKARRFSEQQVNFPSDEKSEDTPVEKCLKAPRVPTETGFKLRVALPSSQESKGYTFVNFEWTPLPRSGDRL
jgi:hypothetical protein